MSRFVRVRRSCRFLHVLKQEEPDSFLDLYPPDIVLRITCRSWGCSVVDKNHKGKRRRNDSDDEDGGGPGGIEAAPHKKPVRDVFRQRMQANLTAFDD